MSDGKPKTMEELLEDKLRAIDSRLSVVKRKLGMTTTTVQRRVNRFIDRRVKASGDSRFVKVGGEMIEGTDQLEALLGLEEAYTDMHELQGKDPVAEASQLLEKKIKILKKLMALGPREGGE
jgi:hypothetical protein